jgi:hypothetical protein
MDWTDDIERVLEQIRINTKDLENIHKLSYFSMKDQLKYYRLPVIVISGCNSVISVSLQTWIAQDIISMTTCILALLCGLIGSVELYLGINKQMEIHLSSSRDYYVLSSDICKTLLLSKEHRPVPAKEYLDEVFNNYIKFYEKSVLINKKLDDKLQPSEIMNSKMVILMPSSQNNS